MGTRITVKYTGAVRYNALATVPEGTEFKGVEVLGSKEQLIGVNIRGSNLRKASGKADTFPAKIYYFPLGNFDMTNEMEVV